MNPSRVSLGRLIGVFVREVCDTQQVVTREMNMTMEFKNRMVFKGERDDLQCDLRRLDHHQHEGDDAHEW